MGEPGRAIGAKAGMFEPIGVILLRIVAPLMRAATFGTKECGFDDDLRRRQHVVELASLDRLIDAVGRDIAGCGAREIAQRSRTLRERVLVPPVLSQNLNPDVLMMESTEDWYRSDAAEPLWAPQIGRILCQ